jgi:hypothetical protein
MVEDEFDDGEAGPELPPDIEEDALDDEEGRFFGGGMERKTAQAMEYIDQQEEGEGEAPVWNFGRWYTFPSADNVLISPRNSTLRGCAASH